MKRVNFKAHPFYTSPKPQQLHLFNYIEIERLKRQFNLDNLTSEPEQEGINAGSAEDIRGRASTLFTKASSAKVFVNYAKKFIR